jgi:hypothetical protein
MGKRPRPTASENEDGDEAMMERVKRLAIRSRATPPPFTPSDNVAELAFEPASSGGSLPRSAQGYEPLEATSVYREQALRLRSLHFERIGRSNLTRQHEEAGKSDTTAATRIPDPGDS